MLDLQTIETKGVSSKPAGRLTSRTGWGLPPQFENVPPWLRALPSANWTAEPRGETGKMQKVPRHPDGGWMLSVRKPERWASFAQVVRAYENGHFDGVGVLMSASSGLVGVDVDGWQETLKSQVEVSQALAEFKRAGGYVELSPSGKGLHAFLRGSLGTSGRNNGGLEIYDDVRFLTVTGIAFEEARHD